MDRIGKVQRHPPARQGDQSPLGREYEHLVQIHLELGVLDPVLAALAVLDHLDQVAQVQQRVAPAVGLHGLAVKAIGLVLVGPVRGHPVLGHAIHVLGADLHLDAQAARPDHGRMQRAIVVRLGRRDEVLEPLGHHGPGPVDHAQGAIAVVLAVHDDAEAIDVRQGRKAHRLALQLAPDRIGRLLAALDPGLDPRLAQHLLDLGRDRLDGAAVLQLQGFQAALDGDAGGGVQVLERQFFQLGCNRMNADRAAQRRIDLQRFAADPLALLRLHEMQGAHVVQAVRQLDQQHPHIARNGQDELAKVLSLTCMLGLEFQPRKLGHALNKNGDLLAEHIRDVVPGGRGILDHIVQQGGDDRRCIQPIMRQDACHLDRMGKIGIARGPQLRAMHLHRIDIGLVQQGLVRRRVIGPDRLDQLELAHDRRAFGFGPEGRGRSIQHNRRHSGKRLGRGR